MPTTLTVLATVADPHAGLRVDVVTGTGFGMTFDTADGGEGRGGPSPTESVLAALAGCTSMDVAAILRKNPSAEVLPFDFDVVKVKLNPRDSVMTNAARLASVGGGGTNCSAPPVTRFWLTMHLVASNEGQTSRNCQDTRLSSLRQKMKLDAGPVPLTLFA